MRPADRLPAVQGRWRHRPRSWFIVCGVLLLPVWNCAPAAGADTTIIRAWLDAEVPPRLAAADVPALVVAVVSGDDHIVAGYGVDAERAVFRVGSVSKPVTATVLLSLADEGLIRLTEGIGADLAVLPVEPPLDTPLTLHQLLTHTAGFNERLFGQHSASAERSASLDAFLKRHLPPRFIDPGHIIAYNDHHTALAGWLAEQRTGRRFADLARDRVFDPLGMHDSSFEQIDLPPHMTERLVPAYPASGAKPYPRDYLQLPPAAGLYTTAPDMARYLRGLLSGALPGVEAQLTVQFRHLPELPGRGYGFAEGRHGTLTTFYKDGQASGFNARLLLVPERSFGLFVAHNRNIFGPFGTIEPAGRLLRGLGADLLALLWPLPAKAGGAERENPAPPRPADLSAYPGTYRTVIAARHTWERLASLFDEAVIRENGAALSLGSQRYLPADPPLFVSADNPASHIGFRLLDDSATHLFIGSGAYERVAWWTSQAALPWVLGVPLVMLIFSVWRLLRLDPWRVATGQLALLVFFVGLALVFYLVDLQRLFQGPPAVLLLLLALPPIAVVSLVLQTLRLGQPRPAARLTGIAAGLVLITWLGYWNLLGYHLG